jgi:hypothetical protein
MQLFKNSDSDCVDEKKTLSENNSSNDFIVANNAQECNKIENRENNKLKRKINPLLMKSRRNSIKMRAEREGYVLILK